MLVSITLFAFSISSTTKSTKADLMLLWPTTSPTARLQSSNEQGKDFREILNPCFLLSLVNSIPLLSKPTSKTWQTAKTTHTSPKTTFFLTHQHNKHQIQLQLHYVQHIETKIKIEKNCSQTASHTHTASFATEPLLHRLRIKLSGLSLPELVQSPPVVVAYVDDINVFVQGQGNLQALKESLALYKNPLSARVNYVKIKSGASLVGKWSLGSILVCLGIWSGEKGSSNLRSIQCLAKVFTPVELFHIVTF